MGHIVLQHKNVTLQKLMDIYWDKTDNVTMAENDFCLVDFAVVELKFLLLEASKFNIKTKS